MTEGNSFDQGNQNNNKFESGLSVRNLPPPLLIEYIIRNNEGVLSDTGAVIINTGVFTGRSPRDKFIVDNGSKLNQEINWGQVNKPMTPDHYNKLYAKMINYLHDKENFIQNVMIGNHPAYQKSVKIISEKAWASLFARDLFITTLQDQNQEPEYTVFHAPGLKADPSVDGTESDTFIVINYEDKVILIGSTSYAGEIKKSVFSLMNGILPNQDVLPMHCSANVGQEDDCALFFGLSGTGKTTLSASKDRFLVGDDEHGWGMDGVFNFEGGCYAKTVNLSEKYEPAIYKAARAFGSVLENVGYDPMTREIDFDDTRLTENTRAAYALSIMDRHVESGQCGHPKNIFFLSADAFGVLPPISLLSYEQAVSYFLLGYTAKLGGTEKELGSEPIVTFSTCFGEPFLPLSPVKYARMLLERIEKHKPDIWLINTGWTGGPFGIGSRINLPYSRAMIRAALSGELTEKEFNLDEVFGLNVPETVEGVPDEVLHPIHNWPSKKNYLATANNLKSEMQEHLAQYPEIEGIISK